MVHSSRELTSAERLTPQLCWLQEGQEAGDSCESQGDRTIVARGAERPSWAGPARGHDPGAERAAVLASAAAFLAVLIGTVLLGSVSSCSVPGTKPVVFSSSV